jgi:hypothetical protein
VDKDEAYIVAVRDTTLDFMLRNTEDAEDAACVVVGTIYAMMIFMQQTTEEAEVAQVVKDVTQFFTETSKQLLEILPKPSEGAVVYHGPAGNA